jgi:protein O-mannosyl-transferase
MAKQKPTTMKWKPLLQSIADCKEKGTRYAFLLGAGASISSGIPGANKLTTDWLRQIEENDPDEHRELIERPEYDPENIAALYTEVYRVRFQKFPGDGYRAIEDIMSDKKKVWPSIGYSILAQVMNQTRHNLVLTTNFDRLTETALLSYQNVHARVIAHETMLDVIAIDEQQPSIVKVHRDMFFSPMSTEGEVCALDGKWPDRVTF